MFWLARSSFAYSLEADCVSTMIADVDDEGRLSHKTLIVFSITNSFFAIIADVDKECVLPLELLMVSSEADVAALLSVLKDVVEFEVLQ